MQAFEHSVYTSSMSQTDNFLTKSEFVTYMDRFRSDFKNELKHELKTELKSELKAELLPEIETLTKRVVGDVVGEIISDAMQIISKEFAGLRLAVDKNEYRLNATVSQVDGHEIRLRRLEA